LEKTRGVIPTKAASVGFWLHETGNTTSRPRLKRRFATIIPLVVIVLVTIILFVLR
jgi:hypothetical protein